MLDGLLGISSGSTLTLSPQPVRLLEWVEGELETQAGRVKLSWRWQKNGLLLTATLPVPAELKIFGRVHMLAAGRNELLLEI